MKIGAGIFLIVVGAILSFGVRDSFDAVDLTSIGYILMAAGVLGIILSVILDYRRRNAIPSGGSHLAGNAPNERTVVSERYMNPS